MQLVVTKRESKGSTQVDTSKKQVIANLKQIPSLQEILKGANE